MSSFALAAGKFVILSSGANWCQANIHSWVSDSEEHDEYDNKREMAESAAAAAADPREAHGGEDEFELLAI